MRLTGLALCLGLSSACLFPQDDVILDPEPEQRNRPPRIVETQVQPTSRFLTVEPGDNCILRFAFPVEDPDLEDNIEVEWYVDDSPPSNPQLAFRQPLRRGDNPVRPESAVFESQLNNPSSRFQNPGTYLVEAVIADGSLFNRQVQQPETPDGGVANLRYTDSISWLVTLTLDPATCVGSNP